MESQTERFGDSLIVAVNRLAEENGIVGNDGVCQLVIVQDCAAAGRSVDNVDAVVTAIIEIDRSIDFLVPAERYSRPEPRVKTQDGSGFRICLDFIEER